MAWNQAHKVKNIASSVKKGDINSENNYTNTEWDSKNEGLFCILRQE